MMQDKITNVLFFFSDYDDGVAFHRLRLPALYLQNINVRTRTKTLFPQDMEWANVLVISRLLDGKAEDIRKRCDDFNVKLVVDVDDLWILPTNHILHTSYIRTGYAKKQEEYLRVSDQVWTTNIRLAEEIKPFNANVFIIPNALPFGDHQFTPERTQSDRVRFFYAGGHTHKHDIALLSEVCRMMRKDPVFKEKGQFVLAGGYHDMSDVYVHGIWDKMEKDYSGYAVGKPTYKRLYSLPVDNYMDLYNEADVGLVALEENRFTRCKSNLKILECAAKKIPMIVSNVETYTDGRPPVYFVRNGDNKAWANAIDELLRDAGLRQKAGEVLYHWATKHHELRNINKLREFAISAL